MSPSLVSGMTQEEQQAKAFSENREFGGHCPDKVSIPGELLSMDALTADGAGGMRAGKSWLHGTPVNEIRTNL